MSIGKYWCFTLNNYTEDDDPLKWPCQYVVYQKELSETGTPHMQGYMEFNTNKRISALKKIHGTAHWERRNGTQEQAIAYCKPDKNKPENGGQNDATYVAGPWEAGAKKVSEQGKRNDLVEACQAVKECGIPALIADHPRS